MMKTPGLKGLWYTAIAAGAAGSPSVYGAIRYTDVPDMTGGAVNWDLNNNGTIDFQLQVGPANKNDYSRLMAVADGTGVAELAALPGSADRLNAGEIIDSSRPFSASSTLYNDTNAPAFDWGSAQPRGFLGLRISVSGNTHYGWADVSVNKVNADTYTQTLYAYAYDDLPNQSIIAGAIPEPSTATLLVAGAAGAASLRRRRQA